MSTFPLFRMQTLLTFIRVKQVKINIVWMRLLIHPNRNCIKGERKRKLCVKNRRKIKTLNLKIKKKNLQKFKFIYWPNRQRLEMLMNRFLKKETCTLSKHEEMGNFKSEFYIVKSVLTPLNDPKIRWNTYNINKLKVSQMEYMVKWTSLYFFEY